MRVIATGTLREFWLRPGRIDAEQPLKTWLAVARAAEWKTPADIKAVFGSADVIAGNRVIFNMGGNKYRLASAIHYRGQRIYIRFIGTHAAYDKIDAATV